MGRIYITRPIEYIVVPESFVGRLFVSDSELLLCGICHEREGSVLIPWGLRTMLVCPDCATKRKAARA